MVRVILHIIVMLRDHLSSILCLSLRMAYADRVLEVCADDLHVSLNVAHASGVFMSKVNMHASYLVHYW